MKKAIGIAAILLIALLIAICLGWFARTDLAAHFISSHLKVPVAIQSLDLTKTNIDISNLWIGTPSKSRTSTSFSAKTIEVDTKTTQILSNPLLIDKIEISNIFVGIEYYKNKSTNWTYMLGNDEANGRQSRGRDYLIRTLILKNLTVEVVESNGQKKQYPTIARMEFHNINSETGIPIQEIEKAIFKLMMKDIIDKFNLINIPGNTPLKYLPGLFN